MRHFLSIFVLGFFILNSCRAQKALKPLKAPEFRTDTTRIESNGAKPNGYFLNTNAIQKSIDDCSKSGGGVVLVSPGLWLTGPLVLKSNVNLHLQEGATLLFSNDKSLYPLVEANWEGLPQMRNQSPLSATREKNFAITGKGIIDGNGDAWRAVKSDKLTASQWKKLLASGGVLSADKKTWYPSESYKKGAEIGPNPGALQSGRDLAHFESIKDFLRPNLLLITECKDILLEGVTFQNSPAWCLHPLMSKNIIVRGISVKNPWYAQNGDGIDLESCKDVLIENSVFDVGDDALCMKSGRDAEGRKRAMPTENVVIRYCTVYASHGGFVIGSEMSGGARNIEVSYCTFIGSDIGLRFKTTRGRGGIVENIRIHHIYMKDIPGDAILFDMYYAAKDPIPLEGEKRELPVVEFKPVDETTPVFRNFHISDVYCYGANKGIFIRGLPEMPVQNIVLENMVLQARIGMDIQEASSIVFKNIQVETKNPGPVVDVIQSKQLVFENISSGSATESFFRFSGDRVKEIVIKKTGSKSKTLTSFELGASSGSVMVSND